MKVSGLKTNEKKKTLLKKPFGLEQIAGAAIVMSKYLLNTQKYSDHFGKSLGNYSRRAVFLCYENVTVKDAAFFYKVYICKRYLFRLSEYTEEARTGETFIHCKARHVRSSFLHSSSH